MHVLKFYLPLILTRDQLSPETPKTTLPHLHFCDWFRQNLKAATGENNVKSERGMNEARSQDRKETFCNTVVRFYMRPEPRVEVSFSIYPDHHDLLLLI